MGRETAKAIVVVTIPSGVWGGGLSSFLPQSKDMNLGRGTSFKLPSDETVCEWMLVPVVVEGRGVIPAPCSQHPHCLSYSIYVVP